MQQRFLRPKQAAAKAAISKSQLYRLVNEGKFPAPIRVSERISAFLESEVDDWMRDRVQESRTQDGAA